MHFRRYSKKVVKEERECVKKKGEREYVVWKRIKNACERASGNAHYAFLRIVTSIRTTPFVFLFFCLSLLLCFQLSIFLYAPFSLSLSRHILQTRWNGPSVFFLSVLFFPSIDTTTSYHRPKAAIEPM